MNLMERKNRKENNNPEQLEDGHSSKAEDDLEIVDLNEPDEDEAEAGGGLHELLQKPYMTTVLMWIIVLLLVCDILL